MQDTNNKNAPLELGRLIHILSCKMKCQNDCYTILENSDLTPVQHITRTSIESDARLKQLVPTEKAETLRPRIVEHIKKCEAALSAGIPDDKLHVCREVLCQMLDNLAASKCNCTDNKKEA